MIGIFPLCSRVLGDFICSILYVEKYFEFAGIPFENIDTVKKYRDNIDTIFRRYPSPTCAWSLGPAHYLERGADTTMARATERSSGDHKQR